MSKGMGKWERFIVEYLRRQITEYPKFRWSITRDEAGSLAPSQSDRHQVRSLQRAFDSLVKKRILVRLNDDIGSSGYSLTSLIERLDPTLIEF